MNKKEKKAIEELKNRQGYRVDFKCKRCNSGDVFIIPPEVLYGKEIDIALNLIDRLQKENEELKAKTNLKDLKEKLEGLDINYYKPLIEKIEELLKDK